MTPKAKKTAGWLAICVGCVGGFEGLRTVAYLDPVGIPTACFGETQGIRMGDKFTVAECRQMLGERVIEFGNAVDRCITYPMPDKRKAAFTSLAYNIGSDAFCKSSIARKYNKGDVAGACDAMLLYVKAKGVTLPGLVKRREAERQLCLDATA